MAPSDSLLAKIRVYDVSRFALRVAIKSRE